MIAERNGENGNNVLIRDKVEYVDPNVAYFPTLSGYIKHGFTWGVGIPNYSYAREPGFPDQTSIEAVKSRIDAFLRNIGLGITDRTVVLQAPVTNHDIVDIDDDFFSNQETTNQGTFAEAGAIFTSLIDTTFTVPPGDCRWAIVYAKSSADKDILGFIHLARELLDNQFLSHVSEHLKDKYGAGMEDVRVGITPGLSQKYHTLEEDNLGDSNEWGGFLRTEQDGLIHVDTLGYAIQQLHKHGIQKIDAYADTICTYDAALRGDFYASHRYASDQEKPEIEGRILIAAQLV